MSQNAVKLITLAFLLICFIILLNLWYQFKNIKVIKNRKDLSAEEMQVKIEQLKIIKKVSALTENKFEKLVRLSGNPLHLTPTILATITYIVPLILLAVSYILYINGQGSLVYFTVMVAVICFWYPPYHYKEQVKARSLAWYKVHQYIFKIEDELTSNGYKKALINVSVALRNVKENEMAKGFEAMVEFWPDTQDDTLQSIERFKEDYPFDIASDLYTLLLNAEDSGVDPTSRLESFKGTVIRKYDKFANDILNGIPAFCTAFSLPFLMLSCIVALLVPSIYELLQMF